MALPFISINICVLSNRNPSVVLSSLKKLDYPKHKFEVIVIEGNHLTKQRNKGIKKSKGEIIYLLDDDAIIKPNALKLIAKAFNNTNVAALGGPSLTPKEPVSYFSKVVGYLLETYFGAFRMRFKWSKEHKRGKYSDYDFIGANLALRKSAVVAIGGFDETFQANDETELIRRLKDNGYLLKYSNHLYIFRQQRKNIVSLIKQFYHYGKGRMRHIAKNPKKDDYFLLAPMCFTVYLATLLVIHSFLYLTPFFFYSLLGLLTSTKAAIKYKRPDLLISMSVLYPVVHISYSFGLLHEGVIQIKNMFGKTNNTVVVSAPIRVKRLQVSLLYS
jgi:succinoglycan biosynthesis protein ExoA